MDYKFTEFKLEIGINNDSMRKGLEWLLNNCDGMLSVEMVTGSDGERVMVVSALVEQGDFKPDYTGVKVVGKDFMREYDTVMHAYDAHYRYFGRYSDPNAKHPIRVKSSFKEIVERLIYDAELDVYGLNGELDNKLKAEYED